MKKVLNIINFADIPIHVFTAVILYAFFLLLGMVQGYLVNNPLVLFDVRITNFFYIFRNETFLNIFYFITLFAESLVVIALSTILSIFFWFNKQHIYVFFLWLTLAVGEGIAIVSKYLFHIERPALFLRAVVANSFSFPSGHATSVVLFYGFLVYLIFRNYESLKIRAIAFLSFLSLVVLVDLSRLYLGVHYFSDVIAGNLVGFATLILLIEISEWFITKKLKKLPSRINLPQIYTFLFMVLVFVSISYCFQI
ncbi:MAG: PA-phosphatase-like phosphoesterase [Parcubacteria group bacterium Athens0714_16]|nr:MAG: PA-phosphatase-like phosphoesterase [Parcubacteria group bacterium Athens0714_16]